MWRETLVRLELSHMMPSIMSKTAGAFLSMRLPTNKGMFNGASTAQSRPRS